MPNLIRISSKAYYSQMTIYILAYENADENVCTGRTISVAPAEQVNAVLEMTISQQVFSLFP